MEKPHDQHRPITNQDSSPWPVAARWAASAAIVFHLTAVFIAPLSQPAANQVTSPLTDNIKEYLGPYIQAADIDYGYRFFAPQPGASHLCFYRLQTGDGDDSHRGHFPNSDKNWPRLNYHRHFMLTEQIEQLHIGPIPLDRANDEAYAPARYQRKLYESVITDFANHLMKKEAADRAELYMILRPLPSPRDIKEGFVFANLELLERDDINHLSRQIHRHPSGGYAVYLDEKSMDAMDEIVQLFRTMIRAGLNRIQTAQAYPIASEGRPLLPFDDQGQPLPICDARGNLLRMLDADGNFKRPPRTEEIVSQF